MTHQRSVHLVLLATSFLEAQKKPASTQDSTPSSAGQIVQYVLVHNPQMVSDQSTPDWIESSPAADSDSRPLLAQRMAQR
jgi:hypothetical protein